MKKVAILAMTGAQNYGTILQAIALKKILLDNNIEPHFINYQTNRQKRQYSVVNTYIISVKVVKKNILNIMNLKKVKQRIKKYNLFIERELFKKKSVLKSKKEVINYLKDYDTVIVGSDQIWNLTLNDSSSVYFLDFPKHEKRIAYAVSLGGSCENFDPYKDYILSKVQNFDSISVREDIAMNFFKSNNIHVEQTLDPALLIESSWWEKAAIQLSVPDSEYIVYYSVNCKPYSVNICQTISDYLRLPVYNLYLHPGIAKTQFIPFFNLNPFEFLGMIKNAAFVCTDSYHGLIFSILFKKKFIVPAFEEKGSIICEDRKLTLLKKLDLTDRLFTEYTNPEQINTLNDINNHVYVKLDELKRSSIKFILKAVGTN